MLVAFHVGRCSVFDSAYASVEQPKPLRPLPAFQPGLESTVLVELKSGHCSGFIESDYILVTATHCVADFNEVTHTTTYDGGQFTRYENTGQIVANDGNDHVKIRMKHKLRGRHAKIVPMPPPGTPVYIYGHPADARFQLRTGQVVGQYRGDDGTLYYNIDTDWWHGDSGGPIFDKDGNVVGMVTGYVSYYNPKSRASWRINVALPWAFSGEVIR